MIKRDYDIELIEDIPTNIKDVLISFFKKKHVDDVINIDYIRISREINYYSIFQYI